MEKGEILKQQVANESTPSDSQMPNHHIEMLDKSDENTFQQIYEIEKEVSTGNMLLSEADLRSVMEKADTITIVIRDEGNRVLGFVVGLPNSEVYEELQSDDPDFKSDPRYLYIYDLAIGRQKRSLANFLNLIRKLMQTASSKNFSGLSMHTRVSEGLSEILQKRYGAKKVRTIDNWQSYGEPFDYLEFHF